MHTAKPDWIVKRIPAGPDRRMIEETLQGLSLHTVCEQAGCPNIGECFCGKTATFMIYWATSAHETARFARY